MFRDLIDEIGPKIERALSDEYSIESATRIYPNYIFGSEDNAETWQRAERLLSDAYGVTYDDSYKVADRKVRKAEIDPIEVDPIVLAARSDFVRENVGTLIQSISTNQLAAIKALVQEGLDKAENPKRIVTRIRQNIGLLPRDVQAVSRREQLLIEQGLKGKKLDKALDRYRKQLLTRRAENIARTELLKAESFGRREAWKQAERDGVIDKDKVVRVWLAVMGSPRTCPICADLDNETAPLDGTYPGGIEGPPHAHPSCRCSEVLRVQD
jgi:hypothetical protein